MLKMNSMDHKTIVHCAVKSKSQNQQTNRELEISKKMTEQEVSVAHIWDPRPRGSEFFKVAVGFIAIQQEAVARILIGINNKSPESDREGLMLTEGQRS